MIKKYYRYILLFLVGILLVSCKKDDKKGIKGREYITESGFKQEITKSESETKTEETITERFDIKKHPEMWSMTDEETYIYILEDVLDDLNGYKYFDELPLSDNFRKNSKNGIFDYVQRLDRPSDDWEKYSALFEPNFANRTIWCTTFSWTSERQHLIKYYLDVNGSLDSIEVLKTELLYDRITEREAKSMADRPASYENLERYKEVIPDICLAPVYYYRDIDYEPEQVEKKYKHYEGCTERFINSFDVKSGIIYFTDMNNPYNRNVDFAKYVYDIVYNNEYTDLSNNTVGVKAYIYDSIQDKESFRNYKVYFKVDDRNFLDAITKVEEVLENGSVIEVENNFGK